jgi:hypothetical protein
MSMAMTGPREVDRLMETCHGIVNMNNADSDEREDNVCQIYETFFAHEKDLGQGARMFRTFFSL